MASLAIGPSLQILLDALPEKLARTGLVQCSKEHSMRVAGLCCPLHRGQDRSSSSEWGRLARLWLILVACLAQWGLFQNEQLISGTAGRAFAASGIKVSALDVRCASGSGAGTQDQDQNQDAPAPCRPDDCPCCPLAFVMAGVIPPETGSGNFIPSPSKTVTPPAQHAVLKRSLAFAGQPRAPPVLI